MNKMQMQVVINNHESKIEDLKNRDERILNAIKKCFPLPECTDGHQLVTNENYNNLVAEINK